MVSPRSYFSPLLIILTLANRCVKRRDYLAVLLFSPTLESYLGAVPPPPCRMVQLTVRLVIEYVAG